MKLNALIAVLILSSLVFAQPANAATTTTSEFLTPAKVEVKVRDYFKDIPVMIEIARCESKFRQYTDSGNVLRGGASGGMIGVFQFFESVHAVPAKSLGFDLATVEGNLGYARHVYQMEGTAPWNPAKDCWNTPLLSATMETIATSTKTTLTENRKDKLKQQIIILTKLITLLQKQLVAKQLAQL